MHVEFYPELVVGSNTTRATTPEYTVLLRNALDGRVHAQLLLFLQARLWKKPVR
ncbi:MAG: hypothetical protein ACFFD4_35265 [Candidatus Odinarchaeota archaeon]